MRLADWPRQEVSRRLAGPGVFLHTGPFLSRIRTRISAVADGIALLYADNPVSDHEDFVDFHIALAQPRNLRRWYRPQVMFLLDGFAPFKPLPLAQALPLVEWGLNWCIGLHAHQYLIVHAATIEKDGCAAILPGPPGSGKSTLTAYLVHNGWRLLSDELALLSPRDGRITALARPISLKNQSIDIIGQVIPGAQFSRRIADTSKGTVALLKAPLDSVRRVAETARPAWVIFPRFKQGAAASLTPRSKADTLIEVGRNAFNYSIHGARGFEVLAGLIDQSACYDFTYSNLAEAREIFTALTPETALPQEVPA